MNERPYLAIETSTPLGSVAIGTSEGVLAEVVLGVRSKHSEALLSAVDYALKSARVDKRDLARIVVGGGPGSFTGLRISGATAKAMATALGLPLYAYSGLAALAAGTGVADRTICALFDARRGEVYAGCYRFPDFARMQTIIPPAPRPIGDVLAMVEIAETVFVGDGAQGNAAAIRGMSGLMAPAHLAVPRAGALLWLCDIAPEGRINDVAAWEPSYLRDSGAERMRAR